MSRFDSGVKGYVKARAVVETNFPIDWHDRPEIACKHCNYFVRSTQRCGLTQTIVNFPERHVGVDCPLTQVEVKEDV